MASTTADPSLERQSSGSEKDASTQAPASRSPSSQGKEEEQPEPTGDAEPGIGMSPIHEVAFIFMICMAQFLALAGLAQSIAPLGIIGRSFGVTDEGELSWYPAAFSLTLGTFILPAGRLVCRRSFGISWSYWGFADFRIIG